MYSLVTPLITLLITSRGLMGTISRIIFILKIKGYILLYAPIKFFKKNNFKPYKMNRKQLGEKITEETFSDEYVDNMVFTQAYLSRIDNQKARKRLCSLAKLGLICNTTRCDRCAGNIRMSLHVKSRIKDSYVWACKSASRHETSIRKHSIFEGMK
jgi:hypothetical protein